jgi:MFS family permease
LAQTSSTRIGAGAVLVVGMTLVGAGTAWAAQSPVAANFWLDVAGPFFVVGAGIAFGFIPISIAGLQGVAEREAGLASGLLNTTQQLGGAIGVAIASTVAASHAKTLTGDGVAANTALTGGFHWAIWVCAVIALLAVPTTAVLVRRSSPAAPAPVATPVPEAA